MTIISDTNDAAKSRASLGTTTNIASGPEKYDPDRVIFERYYLQYFARQLLPEHRIKICHRHRISNAQGVDVKRRKDGKAGFTNLMRCAKVWQCPVCSSVISERRRQELRHAISNPNYRHIMMTFTVSHGINDSFADTSKAIKTAHRALRSGRWYQQAQKEWKIAGNVRTHEITYGKNGWHPHIHEVIFTELENDKISADGLTEYYLDRWLALIGKQGYHASREHGLKVTTQGTRLANYITKFGRLPADLRWSAAEELSKAVTKRTKAEEGTTPFGLLERFSEGDEQAGKLFQEYVFGTFREQHLRWSPGLKDLLGIDDISDSEILEHETDEYDILTTLTGEEWIVVKRFNLQSNILILARHGDTAGIHSLIQKHMERL